MSRVAICLMVWLFSSIELISSGSAETPAWTATEMSYVAALTLGKRLTPSGTVDYQIPEGFRGYSDTASAGFGTFQIAVPDTWSAWTIAMGTSALPIIDVFEPVDPNRARRIERLLKHNIESGAYSLRGMFAVGDGGAVAVVEASILGRLNNETLDRFHQYPDRFYNQVHNGDLQEVAWFDHHQSKALRTTSSYAALSRMSIDYFIVEKANTVLWNVRCTFPETRESHYQALCDDMIETFAAGAFIERAKN